MSLTPGTRIGSYEVGVQIGVGGMGEVYRARDTTLDRDVALKLLPDALASDPDRLARFHREAKALASLSHPNIANIYGLEQSAGRPCIVMELLDGQTLRQRIALGPLPVRHAVDVAIAIAEALAAVHAQGITHRDLKPENIFLTADGRIKILDFGLARSQASDTAAASMVATETHAGVIMGTLGYMSPEQVRGEKAEAPSDLFALGCVLYEMLSGRVAFERPSPAETMAAILKEEPQALDHVGADLGRILRRCLKKPAHERFQSARDVAFDLRRVALSGSEDEAPADSLAVLPFANTGGADAEYLSDGIAENLINAFSQIARLRVVPRSVAFRYKGQDVDPRDVARQLDVRMLLSGKVVERGGRLSVQVELVDAVANKQLWGERIVRPLADIFEVEEAIARQIADQLRLRLTGEDKKQLARRYTEDSEAYQLYLRARYHFLKRTADGLQKGVEYCEQAIAKDRDFALAHAALADCYLVLTAMSLAPPGQTMDKARAAASRAVEADATLAEAHNSLAYTRAYAWEWALAERGFRRALDLNPGSWITHDWYALTLGGLGRLDEALAHNRRAREIEPLSVVLLHHAGWLSWLARRYDEAIEWSRKVLELDPSFGFGYVWSGMALEQQSRHEEAVAALRRGCELMLNMPIIVGALGHACARAGRDDEADRILAELEERSQHGYVEPYAMALIHAGRGRVDRVFEWLEKACDDQTTWITVFTKADPRLDPYRQDPRFAALLRRMGLDP